MCEPFTCVSELIVTCCLPLVEFSEGVCIRPVADFQYLSISIPVLAARDVEANRVECALYTVVSTSVSAIMFLIHLPIVEEVTVLWGLVRLRC